MEKVKYGGMADCEGFAYAVVDGKPNTRYMLVPSARGKDLPDGVTEVQFCPGL